MIKITNVLKGLTIVLSLALTGLLVLAYNLEKETEALNKEVRISTTVVEDVSNPTQPIGVLLLGIDSLDGGFEQSRSDAILVASINPEQQTTELVTIPRDTIVEMDEIGGKLDKINHAYVFGGVDGTIKTVSNYLDIPIHYVVEINIQGLEALIDAIGGIELTPTISFVDEGHEYVEGELTEMNGHKALTYARMRKKDPKGDVGRGERQQEIMGALADKLISVNAVTNYGNILDVIKGNMRTNVPISAGFIKDYLPALQTIQTHSATEYRDLTINRVYYLGLAESERVRFSNALRGNLGLNDTTVDKQYILDNALEGVLSGYTIRTPEATQTIEQESVSPQTHTEIESTNPINEYQNGLGDSEDDFLEDVELYYGGEFSVDPTNTGAIYTEDDFND